VNILNFKKTFKVV